MKDGKTTFCELCKLLADRYPGAPDSEIKHLAYITLASFAAMVGAKEADVHFMNRARESLAANST